MKNNNFDFLRFCAAMMVILAHAFPLSVGNIDNELLMLATNRQMDFGSLGVAIFFVISGYLITKSYDRRDDFTFFVKARFLRMIPALVCVTILSILAGAFITTHPLKSYISDPQTLKYLINISAIKITYALPGVFDSNIYPNAVNGSLWTIPFEVMCYVMVASLGLMRMIKGRYVALVFIAIMSASILTGELVFSLAKYFAAGMMLYAFRENIPMNKYVALVCAVILLVSSQTSQLVNIMPIAGSYLVIYIAFNQSIRMNGFGKYGDFSYGIYVYAFPVQQIITWLNGGSMNPFVNAVITIPIVIILAALSWHLVESPCLALKDKKFFKQELSMSKLKAALVASLVLNFAILGAGAYQYRHVIISKLKGSNQSVKVGLPQYYEDRVTLFSDIPVKHDSIVFVGDSLTNGAEWRELLGNDKVINRGINGDTTYGLLDRISSIANGKPEKIFLMIGVNDMVLSLGTEKSFDNYRAILNKIKTESPDSKVYVESLLPVNEGMYIYPGKVNNKQIAEYNEKLKSIVSESGYSFIDMHDSFMANGELKKEFTHDGIHMSGKGYETWVNNIKQYL